MRAQHRFAAKVSFLGSSSTSGDADGACSNEEGFGFGLVGGTLIGLEITAPSRWSAIDASKASDGTRSRNASVIVHDVNVDTQTYYAYGNCAQQGALDLEGTDLEDSVVYRVGQRTGNDPTRGSSTLTTCINYHAVYVQHEVTVTNDLFVDVYGGWCVHGWKPTDIDDVIEKSTMIGCHQGGVILPIFPTNRVNDNVIVRGRTDTAGPVYGACIMSYHGGTLDAVRLAGNVCRGNPHDAIYHNATGDFSTAFLDVAADVTPALMDAADVVLLFDQALTPSAKRDVLRRLSVDRNRSNGAGYVAP